MWNVASTNLSEALRRFAPHIKAFIPRTPSASAGVGLTVLQFVLSILISGILLTNARGAVEVTSLSANRLFGEKGPEIRQLVDATIRSVTTGILGVAAVQSVLAGLRFLAVKLPGADLWAVVFLVAAVLQVGALVRIPAVICVFVIATTSKAAFFLVWCVIVALIDNVVKPLLLGRGVAVPIAVVFLGAIGGFVTWVSSASSSGDSFVGRL